MFFLLASATLTVQAPFVGNGHNFVLCALDLASRKCHKRGDFLLYSYMRRISYLCLLDTGSSFAT